MPRAQREASSARTISHDATDEEDDEKDDESRMMGWKVMRSTDIAIDQDCCRCQYNSSNECKWNNEVIIACRGPSEPHGLLEN